MKICQNTRQLKPFFILLVVTVLFRWLYGLFRPQLPIYPDGLGYWSLGQQMLANPTLSNLVSEFRTPVYPLFIALVGKLVGVVNIPLTSPLFNPAAAAIMLFQTVLGIISVLLFLQILLLGGWQRTLAFILAVFLAGNITVFTWERTLLTEGLAVFGLMLTSYLLIQTIAEPRGNNFFWLLLSFAFNFLLRPAFLLVPLVTLPFLVFYRRTTKVLVLALTVLLGYLAVVSGYIMLNKFYHNYAGIQHVGEIDLLGKILQFNLSVDSAGHIAYFYETVSDYRRWNKGYEAFRFLETYDPDIYTNTLRMNELQEFVRTVISHNFPVYMFKVLIDVPRVMLDTSILIRVAPQAGNSLSLFFFLLGEIYRLGLWLTLLALPLYPFVVTRFLRHPTQKTTILAVFGTLALTQIFLNAFVVYEDHGRLLAPIQPHLLLFVSGSLLILFNRQGKPGN